MWVKYSKTAGWSKLCGTAKDIAAGDMNGDGRVDFLGTWDGQGVYFRNSMNGLWVKIATPADQVTCGDLDADGKADLIGIWPTQGGVWVKYSQGQYLGQALLECQRYLCGEDESRDGRIDAGSGLVRPHGRLCARAGELDSVSRHLE